MSVLLWILSGLVLIALVAFVAARARAVASAGGDTRALQSLTHYYGVWAALMAALPALMVLTLWLGVQPMLLDRHIAAALPEASAPGANSRALVMSDVRRVAAGLDALLEHGALTTADPGRIDAAATDVRGLLAQAGTALGSDVTQPVLDAALRYHSATKALATGMMIIVLAVGAGGALTGVRSAHRDFRARIRVEQVIRGALMAAASIAVLTTAGIVLSLLFETRAFFAQYPWREFFFSATWSPSFSGRGGASQLGILPLLWGTLYVSGIALIVAVPVGLFAAIYLSEYASRRFRAWAKPMIEILAGIPTIVYGLFALITVGPLLRDYFAQPMGFGDSASSVMTAGLVMGIMLIPFVSSLSDDIITAVPQSLRDGSLGLGATRSDTIRQVVVPAALPGIVGAVLLAASRAIGETMIVVLGAGAAARLDLNPFEAMTTVTVKIVSQLTGDTDFAAPETLVAFALGLTLFVITLGLNVLALYIVRTYREQYE
jgi:phosphate transport system permease protein